jgi:hypothetical protein
MLPEAHGGTGDGVRAESSRIHLVLFGMQNRTFGPILQPLIGFSFHLCFKSSSGQGQACVG